MNPMHQVNPQKPPVHPTSFRLTKETLRAIDDGAAMFRMNRTKWIEFLVQAAVSGEPVSITTERAKIEVKLTVINDKPRRPVPKNLLPNV